MPGLVTILTRTLGRPCLPDAAASVAAQTWRPIEWLVVDAAGTGLDAPAAGDVDVRVVGSGEPMLRARAANFAFGQRARRARADPRRRRPADAAGDRGVVRRARRESGRARRLRRRERRLGRTGRRRPVRDRLLGTADHATQPVPAERSAVRRLAGPRRRHPVRRGPQLVRGLGPVARDVRAHALRARARGDRHLPSRAFAVRRLEHRPSGRGPAHARALRAGPPARGRAAGATAGADGRDRSRRAPARRGRALPRSRGTVARGAPVLPIRSGTLPGNRRRSHGPPATGPRLARRSTTRWRCFLASRSCTARRHSCSTIRAIPKVRERRSRGRPNWKQAARPRPESRRAREARQRLARRSTGVAARSFLE